MAFPAMTPEERSHRAATSKAMKRSAERRRCPKCGRKAAISLEAIRGLGIVRACRWPDCGYSHLTPTAI